MRPFSRGIAEGQLNIPTKKDFADLSELLGFRHRPRLNAALMASADAVIQEPQKAEVAIGQLLLQLKEHQAMDCASAEKLVAYRWITADPAFKHLRKALYHGRKKQTPQQWMEVEAGRIAAEIRPMLEAAALRPRKLATLVRRHLNGATSRPAMYWMAGFSKALSTYFYGDPGARARRLRDDLEMFGRLRVRASDSVAAVYSFQAMSAGVKRSRLHEIAGALDKLLREQQFLLEEAVAYIPVERDDDTARERWLVFDLSKTFRGAFKGEKPAAIVHALTFEGIEHRLSVRTIEKQLAKWREQKLRWKSVISANENPATE